MKLPIELALITLIYKQKEKVSFIISLIFLNNVHLNPLVEIKKTLFVHLLKSKLSRGALQKAKA